VIVDRAGERLVCNDDDEDEAAAAAAAEESYLIKVVAHPSASQMLRRKDTGFDTGVGISRTCA